MAGVLDGIRVLDFGRYIAGPYCAALMAEHGAEVIRIEKCEGSEDRYLAPVVATGEGALFLQMNRNKLSMTLDPMTPEGQAIVKQLVRTADVVVANLPPQTLAAMKLDYDTLKATNPDIILTTVSAFGRGGPLSDRVGFDGIGQVMSGAVYMTGEEDKPYRAAVAWVDFATALHCAFGTMVALLWRNSTGQGQLVEGALLASALTLTNAMLIEQAVVKPNRRPTGNRGQTAAPVDIFRTQDGFLLTQVIGQPLYQRWAKLMGEAHWLTDPRFKDDISRGNHSALISERMSCWCAERTSAEALEVLARAKIPAGPVLKPQEALDDAHIAAMGFFQATEFPGMNELAPLAKVPVMLSQTPGTIRRRPPKLGEHTDHIMAKLGYSRDEIATLHRKGII
jgi:crotonobetainyl-CoA:carnitine CoA-transferase CaiB-like acyl-CoA transferase